MFDFNPLAEFSRIGHCRSTRQSGITLMGLDYLMENTNAISKVAVTLFAQDNALQL